MRRSTRTSAPTAALTTGQLTVTHVTSGFDQPLGVVNAGDGTGRLFVVEQRGTVRVVAGGELQPGFFLDIRTIDGGLSVESERGLTGIAFHPDFETNRILFAYYTDGDQGEDLGGDVTITQLEASEDGTTVDVSTADPILEIEHSDNNIHVGGQLLFGPDNHLYAFTGDIGVHGDPDQTALNLDMLVGKTLRITPDLAGGYTIPVDNPFVGPTAGADEIWAFGHRNPWRRVLRPPDRGPLDGRRRQRRVGGGQPRASRQPGRTELRLEPVRGESRLPRAGAVHGPRFHRAARRIRARPAEVRGRRRLCVPRRIFPDLAGHYVLGDFCSGELWSVDASSATPILQEHRDSSIRITSFGESENGELYMTDRRGALYRVVAPPYTDVADHSLLDHVMWLTNEGISTGCGGGMFCPNASVSRAQMAAFLARALDLPATGTDFFADDDNHPLEISINRVAQAGITSGCAAESYCPSATVTRAEMASFLDRAFDFAPTVNDYFSDDEGSTHENAINRLREANVTGGCTPTTYCRRPRRRARRRPRSCTARWATATGGRVGDHANFPPRWAVPRRTMDRPNPLRPSHCVDSAVLRLRSSSRSSSSARSPAPRSPSRHRPPRKLPRRRPPSATDSCGSRTSPAGSHRRSESRMPATGRIASSSSSSAGRSASSMAARSRALSSSTSAAWTGGFSNGGERGLLGIAFHPDFETNRKLFAYYTDGGGDLIIAELTANAAGTTVSASTADTVIEIEHSSQGNHNGGQLLFGPDELPLHLHRRRRRQRRPGRERRRTSTCRSARCCAWSRT